MIVKGIEKEFDNLGRVVVPIKFRKQLGIKSKSKVWVFLEGDRICITPAEKRCALCGSRNCYNDELRLCEECIEKIKIY